MNTQPKKKRGWKQESARHSLARKGVKTNYQSKRWQGAKGLLERKKASDYKKKLFKTKRGRLIKKKMKASALKHWHGAKGMIEKKKASDYKKKLFKTKRGRLIKKKISEGRKKFYQTSKGVEERKKLGERDRIYRFNKNFFSKLTPQSAYVLGFWMADGYVSGKHKNLIAFTQTGSEILKKIKKTMKATHPITEHNRAHKFAVFSAKARKDLEKIMPFTLERKSYEASYPNIPPHLDSHFIRGFFDGDGGVNVCPSGQLRIRFFSGINPSLPQIQQKLIDAVGVGKTKIRTRLDTGFGSARCMGYTGNKQVPQILDWLYKDAGNLYLKRKKAKYDGWKKSRLGKKRLKQQTQTII